MKVSEVDREVLSYLYAGGTVDGWVLPEQPAITFANGRQAKIPVLLGSNADEGTVAIGESWFAELSRSLDNYRAWLSARFDNHAEDVFHVYPAKSDAEVREAFLRLIGDYQRGHAVRALARDMRRVAQPAYLYYFSYPAKGEYARRGLGSFHGLQLSFTSGGFFRENRWGKPDAEDWQLAEIMSAYWTQFAATGNPNKPGLPQWQEYNSLTDSALELGKEVKTIAVPHAERFFVFERILNARLPGLK